MKRFCKISIVFVSVIVALCAGLSAQQKNESDVRAAGEQERREQQAIDELMPLCREILMPNSQARPAGFNLAEHLREVERKRRTAGRSLWGNSGVAFLKRSLTSELDDVKKVCLLQVLRDSRNRRALPILRSYAADGGSGVVSENAKRYLRELRRRVK